MPNAVDYDKLMQQACREGQGKKLLLHVCCAPCSSVCLERVYSVFQTTALFYNPNMDCAEEYEKRKREEIRFLQETGYAGFLDCDYRREDFERIARGLEEEKEGGARCLKCFRLRLEYTAQRARAGGYDYFATTLTLSPLKNAKAINEIGFGLEKEYGVKYLPSDFKKRDGYLRSLQLSAEHNLYRQNYCGCEYSKR